MTTMPWIFFVLVAVPVLGIPAVTLRFVYRDARAAGAGRRSTAVTVVVSALVALAWMSVLWWASASGMLSRMTLLMPAAATVWLLVVLLWSRVPVVARALRAPDAASALIAPQVLRVAGIIFVLAMLIGRLPWLFALPAGLGDIAVGIAAPFVMRAIGRGRYRRAVWFNVFGLLDLAVALALGALTGLSVATQVIPVVPSSAELTQLPLVLIPTTAVPLAIALHVFDLVAIRQRVRGVAPAPKAGALESV